VFSRMEMSRARVESILIIPVLRIRSFHSEPSPVALFMHLISVTVE
jgi:hypothetical protein